MSQLIQKKQPKPQISEKKLDQPVVEKKENKK